MDARQYAAVKALLERRLAWAKTATPEECRADLIASGIYTPAGDLAPQYGGPGWEEWLTANPSSYSYGPP